VDVIHFPDDPRPAGWRQPVLALGNFDGVHRGHAKILERVRRAATEHGGTAVVLTFDPHPTRIVRPDKAPALLMTPAQKREALSQAGMDGMAIVGFTPDVASWDPERFVQAVLVDWLRVTEVWVGANFLFGRERSGNFTLLRLLGAKLGFRAEKIDPIRYKDFVVSSTRIRRLVAEGRVDEAGALLGHHYTIEGVVVEGKRRGRTLGFPTANLQTGNELVPPDGVYASFARIDGAHRPAVTNIGIRPTFGNAGYTIEAHLLGMDVDLYGQRLELAFVQRLRDERRFESAAALVEQITIDRDRALRLFERLSL